MISRTARLAAIVAIASLISGSAVAQSPAVKRGELPASFTVISPIWDQLVRFSMPSGFVGAFENTKDNFYIREAVLKGETMKQWSQMITVTGAKGGASAPNFTPERLAGSIAGGFKRACPDSFSAKGFGETKLGDREAYVAVAGCGKVDASADKHSEIVLIVAIKGASDAYTVQWAERGPTSSGAVIDEAKWQGRLRALMPIRLCAIVPGETAPYPSCVQQP